jgi:hypothetical protein
MLFHILCYPIFVDEQINIVHGEHCVSIKNGIVANIVCS